MVRKEDKNGESEHRESRGKEKKKEGLAISGSLELGTEVEKQSVEVANPQTSKSWKQPVHEKISAGSCACACARTIVQEQLAVQA